MSRVQSNIREPNINICSNKEMASQIWNIWVECNLTCWVSGEFWCEILYHTWYTNILFLKCEFIHSYDRDALPSSETFSSTYKYTIIDTQHQLGCLTTVLKKTFDIRSQSPFIQTINYNTIDVLQRELGVSSSYWVKNYQHIFHQNFKVLGIWVLSLIYFSTSTFTFNVKRLLIRDIQTELEQCII